MERKTSSAYVTTAVGGSGPSAADIAAAVLAMAQITPIHSDVRKVNSITIKGSGIIGDTWGPV